MFCMHMSVHPSVPESETICFCDISSAYWWIFAKPLSLVHLRTMMNWLGFGVKGSKVKVTLSRRRHPALDPAVKWSFLALSMHFMLFFACFISNDSDESIYCILTVFSFVFVASLLYCVWIHTLLMLLSLVMLCLCTFVLDVIAALINSSDETVQFLLHSPINALLAVEVSHKEYLLVFTSKCGNAKFLK